nr:MAG TPA: hypothetical protein [Caudoviricetes sp.]
MLQMLQMLLLNVTPKNLVNTYIQSNFISKVTFFYPNNKNKVNKGYIRG